MSNKYLWHIYVNGNEHLPDLSTSSTRPLWPLCANRLAHLLVNPHKECPSASWMPEHSWHLKKKSTSYMGIQHLLLTWVGYCLVMHFNSWAAQIQHVITFNNNNLLHSQLICKINIKTRSTLNIFCIFRTCVNFLYFLTEPNKNQTNPKVCPLGNSHAQFRLLDWLKHSVLFIYLN